MISEPGFYAEMEGEEYFSDPCSEPSLNQSGIPDLIGRSPYHFAYKHPRLNPYGRTESGDKAQWLGSAAHRLALGRGKEISTIRYADYQSSAARDARDQAIANGRIPILERDLVRARDMAEILKRQIAETLEGSPYETEVVIAWVEETQYGPIWCRGMLDVWCEAQSMALDPKALRIAATPQAFAKTAADSGYDIQAVFYRRGLSKLIEGQARFVNLVVESMPPHGAQAFELDEASRHVAERQVAQAMELFAKCLHSGQWPSYPRGVQALSTPTYYQNQALNR